MYEPKCSSSFLVKISNLLKDNFSPILAVLLTINSPIVPSEVANSLASSTVLTSLFNKASPIVSIIALNSSFLLTKSVSLLTSKITALFPST